MPKNTTTPNKSAIRVRMYRQGLGDCFLISFPKGKGYFHMLLDCGVLMGTESAAEKMQAVANDIGQETNHQLDLVAVTHEHWDHLSGFTQAQGVFDKMSFGSVWLAWTEDPNNAIANQLRSQRAQQLRVVQAAVARMNALGLAARSQPLQNLLGFYGVSDTNNPSQTGAALDYVKSRCPPVYCTPGDAPKTLPGVKGVRIHVLGPPQQLDLLKKTDDASKVYQKLYGVSPLDSLEAALNPNAFDKTYKNPGELSRPFDPRHCIAPTTARTDAFFREHYGFEANDPAAWRRIDQDWLDTTSELALQLDAATNNTSLVLAIELTASNKVLLFAADAQVGNWLSWADTQIELTAKKGQPVKQARLLERTVLYKVGHHGSHNATLCQDGLEAMTHPDLVALIPVNEDMSNKKKWGMPCGNLLGALKDKTRGRVLQEDKPLPDIATLTKLTSAEKKQFQHATAVTDTYMDFFITP